jgi:hypothetical protein
MPEYIHPHFGQMLNKYITPAAAKPVVTQPKSEPSINLQDLWEKVLFDDILADTEGKLWITYLESQYGVASASELTPEQYADLAMVLDKNNNSNGYQKRREAIYNFVRQHQASHDQR